MALYSLNGGYPAPLQFDDMEDANGRLWTGLASNPQGLAACGFKLAPDPPAFNANTQVLDWDQVAQAWSVTAKPAPPLSDVQTTAVAAAEAAFAAKLADGLSYAGQVIDIDSAARADLGGMALTAALVGMGQMTWPDDISKGWVARGNVRVPLLKPADGIALASTAAGYYSALVQHESDLIAAIMGAADAGAVGAVDVSVGWPDAAPPAAPAPSAPAAS